MNANCETGRTYYFLFYYLWRLFPLLQNADSYVSLDKFLYYLSLKFLLVWILLQFRSCSCLTFAACFAAASSSGAYSSNVFSSFTAPSFTVAVCWFCCGLRFLGFADFFFGGFRHLFRLESDRIQMLCRAAFLSAL